MSDIIIEGLDEIELENTSIDDLATENVNLMFIGIDCSGSMSRFIDEMETSLEEFKSSIISSKEAEEILVARADFSHFVKIGGYKKIEEFSSDYNANGSTALYDVICEGSDKLNEYRKYLKAQGMRVKAVFAIFSDGEDTTSNKTSSDARAAISNLNNEEITTAYIGFGSGSEEARRLMFKNILEVNSSASELRKAFDCLSKSVISVSKSAVAPVDNFFI